MASTSRKFVFYRTVLFFSFLLNLLGWHWLTKLHRFQVHNSTNIIFTLYCVFPPPSQVSVYHHLALNTLLHLPLLPSPGNHHTAVHIYEFLPLSLSLSLFLSLSLGSIPSIVPTNLLPTPAWTTVSLLSIYESVLILLASSSHSLDCTYEWNHIVLIISQAFD